MSFCSFHRFFAQPSILVIRSIITMGFLLHFPAFMHQPLNHTRIKLAINPPTHPSIDSLIASSIRFPTLLNAAGKPGGPGPIRDLPSPPTSSQPSPQAPELLHTRLCTLSLAPHQTLTHFADCGCSLLLARRKCIGPRPPVSLLRPAQRPSTL